MKSIEKTKTRAMVLLENGLQEIAAQLEGNDIDNIAKKTKCSTRTVRRYLLEKEVKKFDMGKKILDRARTVIMEREQSILKSVA